MVKAKKSLGQHFLKSEKTLSQIVAAGKIAPDETILEIGPGQGVLTEKLLERAEKVIAVEKDRLLIPLLRERFALEIKTGKLTLIEGDILKLSVESLQLTANSYKLIANIPYYITGAIIEQFLSAEYQPSSMVLLVQKEVAERMVAKGGKESILSIATKAYGAVHIVAKVPAGAFAPAPQVDSAIIAIENISRDFFAGIDERLFFTTLKKAFGQKRKTLGATLRPHLAALAASGIDPKARPETLSLADWKRLALSLA